MRWTSFWATQPGLPQECLCALLLSSCRPIFYSEPIPPTWPSFLAKIGSVISYTDDGPVRDAEALAFFPPLPLKWRGFQKEESVTLCWG